MLAALVATTPAIAADAFGVKVENFFIENGMATAVFRISNQTGKNVSGVYVDCVFMGKDGKAIDIAPARIEFIPAGGVGFNKASVTRTVGVEMVTCLVAKYH